MNIKIENKCFLCGRKYSLSSIEEHWYIERESYRKKLSIGGGVYLATQLGANSEKDLICDECWSKRYL